MDIILLCCQGWPQTPGLKSPFQLSPLSSGIPGMCYGNKPNSWFSLPQKALPFTPHTAAMLKENLGAPGSSSSGTHLTGNSIHQQSTPALTPKCSHTPILPTHSVTLGKSMSALTSQIGSRPQVSPLTTQTQENSDVTRPLDNILRDFASPAKSKGCINHH